MMRPTIIHKILPKDVYEECSNPRQFEGWRDDLVDGFIHCSTSAQMRGTLGKHFASHDQLVVLSFDASHLPGLKWEISRDNAEFPHIYGQLDLHQALSLHVIARGKDGHFVLPEDWG